MTRPLFLLLFTISFTQVLHSQCSCTCDVQRDSLALVALHQSTNGAFSDIPWNLSAPMNTWSGIFVNDDGCVVRIFRNGRDLSGQLPPEIGDLECLTDLRLASNEIGGEIPAGISNLTCLTRLSLSINQLTGPIPPGIGELQQLESLGLNINELTGMIPAELGNLSNLQTLALNDNQLEGCIPEELLSFCGIDLFNLNGNAGLSFLGHEEDFCNGEEQIGSTCYKDGQFGTINDQCDCSVVSATESVTGETSFQLSPNPAGRELQINSGRHLIREVQVFDTRGAFLRMQRPDNRACTLLLGDLVAGVYFVRVFWAEGSYTWKVIKQ